MNRNNYDPRTLHIFDTIAAYFLDVFYNHLYERARQLVESGRAQSITDAYRASVNAYNNGISSARREHYAGTIKKLHEYYQQNNNNIALTLGDFEDKILSKFIPKEFYRDFTSIQKDSAMRTIIVRTVKETAEILIGREMIGRIIDYHGNSDDVIILQDRILHILMFQNEEYYAKFTKQILSKNEPSSEIMEINKRLKNAFIDEKKKCQAAIIDRDRAINIASALATKMRELEMKASSTTNDKKMAAISADLLAAKTLNHSLQAKNDSLEQRISRLIAAADMRSADTLTNIPKIETNKIQSPQINDESSKDVESSNSSSEETNFVLNDDVWLQ